MWTLSVQEPTVQEETHTNIYDTEATSSPVVKTQPANAGDAG